MDLRGIQEIPDGNRFLIFTLFPQGNIQVKVADDKQSENTTSISVGYNIFNTTSTVNVGELLSHTAAAGTKSSAPAASPTIKPRQRSEKSSQP